MVLRLCVPAVADLVCRGLLLGGKSWGLGCEVAGVGAEDSESEAVVDGGSFVVTESCEVQELRSD